MFLRSIPSCCCIIFILLPACLFVIPSEAATAVAVFEKYEYDVGVLEEGVSASFDLPIKNISTQTLKIISVESSCGCTEAVAIPKILPSGKQGVIRVTINTTAKIGKVVKTLDLFTDLREKPFIFTFRANIAHTSGKTLNAAVIFQGNCRKCHVGNKIASKKGEILFNAVCFICHPNYSGLGMLSKAELKKTILEGVSGTSMPGFAETSGGPLTPAQIDSLVEFLKVSSEGETKSEQQ